MESLPYDHLVVFTRTVGIFLWTLLLLRLLGKRRLAHATYMDLLLIISFGSAVGDVMIYPESTARFWTSVIAITTIAVIVYILDEVASRSAAAHRIIDGSARMVIERGAVQPKALMQENLNEDALLSLLREKGVDAIHKVKWAYLEPDGELSVSIYNKYK